MQNSIPNNGRLVHMIAPPIHFLNGTDDRIPKWCGITSFRRLEKHSPKTGKVKKQKLKKKIKSMFQSAEITSTCSRKDQKLWKKSMPLVLFFFFCSLILVTRINGLAKQVCCKANTQSYTQLKNLNKLF